MVLSYIRQVYEDLFKINNSVLGNDIKMITMETEPLALIKDNKVAQLKTELDSGKYTPNVSPYSHYHKSLFSFAVSHGRKAVVQLFLCYDANVDDVDRLKMSPLMIAAGLGHDGIIDLLLQHNADICLRDDKGRTALDISRFYKNDSITDKLESMTMEKCTARRSLA